ncbi:ParM/StbA family protein [Ancylothrix sp. C2]|uniref:ParM/StbA family protein n=1 Tax=Ancylothrix sp. D3o TaxID=2953691 RepID=UPI0021BA5C17|nr:ParM/StbA family protein [Ancylothrix sp. D3o]MCT7953282.1 ParM/StbA family protein [Ancylothrix sp. D3o]
MATKLNTSPQKLLMALDVGGKGTKCICSLPGSTPISIWLDPEVIPIGYEAVKDVQNSSGAADPENACWIGYDGHYVAVGYLARRKFWGNSRLAELKIATAPWKALAAIWVAAQKLKLGSKFEAVVWALLPGSEIGGAAQFKKDLTLMAANFQTPTGPHQIKIEEFKCLPEGAGVFLSVTTKPEYVPVVREKVVSVAMIGYRNASVINSWKGVLDVGGTSPLGMEKLVAAVANKTGEDAEILLKTIVTLGWNPIPNDTRGIRQGMLLEKAIKDAQESYWMALRSWLLNTIPKDAGLLVFCGGTADYLRPVLEKEFGLHYKLDWHGPIMVSSRLDTRLLGNRLADAYGVFRLIIESQKVEK